jgi:poly(glycerol-phosphate) alpha-glucosyltransferase
MTERRPLDGKRIGLLTASASRLGGGVFEAVVRQAELVGALGGEPVVFALVDRHASDDCHRFGESAVHHLPILGPTQIGLAPRLVPALRDAQLDCLHLHGIWMYPSRAGAVWARTTGRPYFISPHGMLDPWILARGRWKKALARIGYERDGWRRAHLFHALTEHEAIDIAAATGRRGSAVIPNAAPGLGSRRDGPPREPTYCYLGRIHPKKNLFALIDAWEQLAASVRLPQNAQLTIAGWGDPRDVAALESRLGWSPPNVHFVGPVFGTEKARLLRESRALLLPSLGEGLPMVALEAWAAGTPVLMSEFCNLPEGFAAGAAIDCGTSAAGIAEALVAMSRLAPEAWLAMSSRATALADGPFSARTIAARWGEVYVRAIADCRTERP